MKFKLNKCSFKYLMKTDKKSENFVTDVKLESIGKSGILLPLYWQEYILKYISATLAMLRMIWKFHFKMIITLRCWLASIEALDCH